MSHEHNHQFVMAKKEFVQIEGIKDDRVLFEFIEYAYLLCRCNDIVKVVVRNEEGNPSGKKVRG